MIIRRPKVGGARPGARKRVVRIYDDATIQRIRELAETGMRQHAIAREIGCSQSLVSAVMLGEHRLAAGGPVQPQDPSRGKLPRKFDDKIVDRIRSLAKHSTMTQAMIAKLAGCSRQYVGHILHGRRRTP